MTKNDSNWTNAIRHFFRTTTLHGFKYLFSEYYKDRIGWLICCCTGTCCAALLCTVLWERFLEVPAVLELRDLQSEETAYQHMPLIAVCPPVDASAALLVDILTTNATLAVQARKSLAQILSGDITSDSRLQLLESLFTSKNTSLSDLVANHMPSCEHFMLKCRWMDVVVPCATLFVKEPTPWGICCVMRPVLISNSMIQPRVSRYISTKGLDLALQCSNEPTQGCGFFSTYEVDDAVDPMIVAPGYNYFAQLRFTSVLQSSTGELVGVACNPNKNYNKAKCLVKCAERACGCTNPLFDRKNINKNLPPCNLTQMECLLFNKNMGCNCLPYCIKITTVATLESGQMEVLKSALDPIYYGLNTTSTVLHVKVYISLSRIFTMNPTETWFTLLSSLGGVFNMFLGVGLFSALEILFLMFVKLPIAFKNSTQIPHALPSRY